jgi:hypothetical protein
VTGQPISEGRTSGCIRHGCCRICAYAITNTTQTARRFSFAGPTRCG